MTQVSFALAFSFSLIPVLSAITKLSLLHTPFLVTFIALLGLIAKGKCRLPLRLPKALCFQIIGLVIILYIQLVTGSGFRILTAGGYVVLIATCFYIFLRKTQTTPGFLWNKLSNLYKFFIVTLLVEVAVVLAGEQAILAEYLGSEAIGYKTYNQADFARLFGLFINSGGPNSIFLGSQIGGMISLFALIIFLRQPECCTVNDRTERWWLGFGGISLAMTLNGTISAMVAFTILLLYLCRPNKIKVIMFSGVTAIVTYFLIEAGLIFPRIFSDVSALTDYQLEQLVIYGADPIVLRWISVRDFYLYMFFSPLHGWLDAGFIDKLFGFDPGTQNIPTFMSGDFGFARGVLVGAGLLWANIFLFGTIFICYPFFRKCPLVSTGVRSWWTFGQTNAVISLLWLISMVHYPQATENPGAIPLFALNLALTLVCFEKAFSQEMNPAPVQSCKTN